MSSGTGTATSQNSGIGWKDKPGLSLLRWSPCQGGFLFMVGMVRLRRSLASRLIGFAQHDKSLLFTLFGRLEAQVLHDHLQIFPGLAFLPGIAQEKCGMVG